MKHGFVQRIFGIVQGADELYLTRWRIWDWGPYKLFFHKFHRGDYDRAWHDHPWEFWTFPFKTYYESVLERDGSMRVNKVQAFKWHYRHSSYSHIVLENNTFPFYSIIVTGKKSPMSWGFWVRKSEAHKYGQGWPWERANRGKFTRIPDDKYILMEEFYGAGRRI